MRASQSGSVRQSMPLSGIFPDVAKRHARMPATLNARMHSVVSDWLIPFTNILFAMKTWRILTADGSFLLAGFACAMVYIRSRVFMISATLNATQNLVYSILRLDKRLVCVRGYYFSPTFEVEARPAEDFLGIAEKMSSSSSNMESSFLSVPDLPTTTTLQLSSLPPTTIISIYHIELNYLYHNKYMHMLIQ